MKKLIFLLTSVVVLSGSLESYASSTDETWLAWGSRQTSAVFNMAKKRLSNVTILAKPRNMASFLLLASAAYIPTARGAMTFDGGDFYPTNVMKFDEGVTSFPIFNSDTDPIHIASMNATEGTIRISVDHKSETKSGFVSFHSQFGTFSSDEQFFYFVGSKDTLNNVFSDLEVRVDPNLYGNDFVAWMRVWEGGADETPSTQQSGLHRFDIQYVNDAPSALDGSIFSMIVDAASRSTIHPIPGALSSLMRDVDAIFDPLNNGLEKQGAMLNLRCSQGISAIRLGTHPCPALSEEQSMVTCAAPFPQFSGGMVSLETEEGSRTEPVCELWATEGGRNALSSPIYPLEIDYRPSPKAPGAWEKFQDFTNKPEIIASYALIGVIGMGTWQTFYKGEERNRYQSAHLAAAVSGILSLGYWHFGKPKLDKGENLEEGVRITYHSTIPLIGRFITMKDIRFQVYVQQIGEILGTYDPLKIAKFIAKSSAYRQTCWIRRGKLDLERLSQVIQNLDKTPKSSSGTSDTLIDMNSDGIKRGPLTLTGEGASSLPAGYVVEMERVSSH